MGKKEFKLLVVDDEPEIREMISDFLRDGEGYTVYEAENGDDALENVLAKIPIDLVLSDINMPVKKGFELLKEVKDKYPSTKRVLITAYNVEDYLELALKHDIGNIFVKTTPFNFQELSTILSSLLAGDIFGLDKYFEPGIAIERTEIRKADKLDECAKSIVAKVDSTDRARRLELVIVELLTNAIFYGIRNESPDRKELWEHNFELPAESAITVAYTLDNEKYGISVVDNGGRLKKSDVLYWLNRQVTKDENGMPLGLYDSHGRGFFIARRYIDRLIINIDPNARTEMIILNYFSNAYQGYKPLYINEI